MTATRPEKSEPPMLVKWILCQVPDSLRQDFDRAQRAWSALNQAPGFLGQLGGWARERTRQACILGLWTHPQAYERFMTELHDSLADAGQGTYTQISTALFSAPDQDLPRLQSLDTEITITEGPASPQRWPGLTRPERGLGLNEEPGPEEPEHRYQIVLEPAWRVRPQ